MSVSNRMDRTDGLQGTLSLMILTTLETLNAPRAAAARGRDRTLGARLGRRRARPQAGRRDAVMPWRVFVTRVQELFM